MLYLFRLLRNNFFPIYFLILFGFSVTQVVRFNLYQESFYFNTSNSVFNSVERVQNSMSSYFGLREINAALAAENARLKNSSNASMVFIDTGRIIKNDSHGKRRYAYILSNVIKSSTRNRNNFITIDKGSSSGIKRGMAVVSPSGIAGFVFDVAENFSLVLSVLNSQFAATPMIPEANIREGSVTWDGAKATIAQLNGIDKFENIKPGMNVVTSNYSVKFPQGIPIGTITNIRKKGTSSFYEIDLKLATDFNKLGYVYVITDYYKSQLDSLAVKENPNVHR